MAMVPGCKALERWLNPSFNAPPQLPDRVHAATPGMSEALEFSPAAFFYGLLPPIVFAAGFTLKKRSFFRNIGTITLFAVAGTFISTLVFGLLTYLLMLSHVVSRASFGSAPLVECFLYGGAPISVCQSCMPIVMDTSSGGMFPV